MARRNRFTLIPLLAILMCLGWQFGEANAQAPSKNPTVGLFPLQSVTRSLPRKELKTLSRGILYQFRQNRPYPISRRYPLVGSVPPLSPSQNTAEQREKQLKPLYQQLNLSVRLMQKGKYKLAIPKLKKGIKLAKTLVKWRGSIQTLARLRGLLALATLQLGDNEEGETVLQDLARMDPQPLPPELKKSGPLKRLYNRCKRDVNRSPRVRLQLIGTSDAEVFINGRKRGKIPMDLGSLPRGPHYIRVEKEGYKSWGKTILLAKKLTRQRINLKPNVVRQVTPLDQAKSAIKTNILLMQLQSQSLRNAIPRICKAGQINLLLSGNLKKVGNQYYLFTPLLLDCKSQKVSKGDSIQLNTDLLDVDVPMYRSFMKLIKAWNSRSTQVVKLVRRPPPPRQRQITRRVPPQRRPPAVAGTPAHKSWWLWTLVTVGVLGGAAAATTVILMNQPPRISIDADWSNLK